MRGLPYPLHIAPFVIVEICAQKDVVGEAVVIGFQFPLLLGWNAPLPLHAARCTCGSSVVGQHLELMDAKSWFGAATVEHDERLIEFLLGRYRLNAFKLFPDAIDGIKAEHFICAL